MHPCEPSVLDFSNSSSKREGGVGLICGSYHREVAERYCSIIGIGINLNQTVFRGDAPNPVSLFQIIGKEVDREEVLHRFLSIFYRYYLSLLQEEHEDIRARYQSALYRREGYHGYNDESGEFEACIHDIESTGHLLLALRDGSIRRYAFKEVSYCK